MKARWMGGAIESFEVLTEPGDIGLGAANYHFNLLVRCPICHEGHVMDVEGGTGPDGGPGRWKLSVIGLTASPSYKLTNHNGEVCHFNLTEGAFVIHPDSTGRPKK